MGAIVGRLGRIAALEIPRLALQTALRDRALSGERPVVLVEARGGRELVALASRAAEALGIGLGWSVAQAKALASSLVTLPWEPRRAREALHGLAESMLVWSPAVELAPPDALLLDASGAMLVPEEEAAAALTQADGMEGGDAGLFAAATRRQRLGEARERIWAQRLEEAARALGLDARVAVADTPQAARLRAAQDGGGEPLVVGAGHARPAVSGVPLSLVARLTREAAQAGAHPPWVAVGPETWGFLDQLGLKRLGQLLELPPRTLAARVGADAETLLRLARGGQPRPLVPFRTNAPLIERSELEVAVEDATALMFRLRPLVERLVARLDGRGEAAARLALHLETDGGEGGGHAAQDAGPRLVRRARGRQTLMLVLARPTARAGPLVDWLRARLGAASLQAPVLALALEVLETARTRDQLGLGERPHTQEALESVLARLRSRLGDGQLGSVQSRARWVPEDARGVEAYRPEPSRAQVWRAHGRGDGEAPDEAHRVAVASRRSLLPFGERGPRMLRLAEPQPVEVQTGASGGVVEVRWEGGRCGVVEGAAPQRLLADWQLEPSDRDYMTLLLDDGRWVWVFRDAAGQWWLQGLHD